MMTNSGVGRNRPARFSGVAMMSPQDYLGVLESHGVFSFQIDTESPVEAKAGIAESDRLLNVVRNAERAIAQDLSRIRATGQERVNRRFGGKIFGTSFAGSASTVENRRLKREMLNVMQPYESIVSQLEEIRGRLDAIQARLGEMVRKETDVTTH